MRGVPEVKASVIDASSRFTSVAASVIRMRLDEIAFLLNKRKLLNTQISKACHRAQAMSLSPKLARQAAQEQVGRMDGRRRCQKGKTKKSMKCIFQ